MFCRDCPDIHRCSYYGCDLGMRDFGIWSEAKFRAIWQAIRKWIGI